VNVNPITSSVRSPPCARRWKLWSCTGLNKVVSRLYLALILPFVRTLPAGTTQPAQPELTLFSSLLYLTLRHPKAYTTVSAFAPLIVLAKSRRLSLFEKPTSTLSSWLGCYNLNGTPNRAREQAPKSNLDAWTEEFEYSLGDIWQTLQDREVFMKFGEHKRKYCCTCAPPSSPAGARGPIFCLFSSDPEDGIYGQVPNKCYAEAKHTKFRFELLGKEV
jgi:hypothetical protein